MGFVHNAPLCNQDHGDVTKSAENILAQHRPEKAFLQQPFEDIL